MKHYLVLAVVLLATCAVFVGIPHQALAQGGNGVITLNDATPGIDAVINVAPGTSGVVAVQVVQASITVTDSAGYLVFQTSDPRVHTLELRLAPNAGTHTLTAERLPGVTEAYVQVVSQSELTNLGPSVSVSTNSVTFQQQTDLPLTANTPNGSITVNIPAATTGAVIASFPGAPVTVQVVDNSGVVVASLYAGQIDGLSLTLDSGSYDLTLLNANPAQNTVANVSLMPASMSDLAALAPVTPVEVVSSADAPSEVCAVTVTESSIDLRSGPGTGYNATANGFRGDQFQVGGINTDGSWLLVGSQNGSAWMDGTTGVLNGACSSLTVYNIPYLEAPLSQSPILSPNSGFQESEYEDDEFEND